MSRVEITREQYEKLYGTGVPLDMEARYFIDPAGAPKNVPRGTQLSIPEAPQNFSFKRGVKSRKPTDLLAIKHTTAWLPPWHFPKATQLVLDTLGEETMSSADLAAIVSGIGITKKRASYIVGRLIKDGLLGVVCD